MKVDLGIILGIDDRADGTPFLTPGQFQITRRADLVVVSIGTPAPVDRITGIGIPVAGLAPPFKTPLPALIADILDGITVNILVGIADEGGKDSFF